MRKLRGLGGWGAVAAALVLAVASCAVFAAGAAAQSGRKRPAQQPQPQPTAEAEPQGESESEPKPRQAGANVTLSFIVMEEDDTAFGTDIVAKREVLESFTARLGRSASVAVTGAGRGSRGEAHKRAKAEETAYVVLLILEEELNEPGRRASRSNSRSLVLRTHVYAPKTGSLKFSDTIYQRAVRRSVGVGGVRLPVPTGTIGRDPSQLELRQAAQDAADRVLSRFQVAPPPDNP
ncbi:MAG TPA: hypothetical protein VG148_03325 [Pyrinomonadaceae bacterium]|nr:hypothetical protein [Pyrinomonadaceae bacterium]